MKNILHVILVSLFSLTVISCGDSEDSSSSASSSGTTSTTTTTATITIDAPPKPACQTDGSTSRNDNLIVTPTLSRHAEQSGGRLLYVDKSALSQYQTDNYLLFDLLESKIRPPISIIGNKATIDRFMICRI